MPPVVEVPEELTPEQRLLWERVDAFSRDPFERLAADLDRASAAGDGTTRRATIDAIAAAARDAGLFGLAQPVRFGGAGADAVSLCLARERIAATGLAARRFVFGPGPGLLAGVTGTLENRYLAPLMRGESRTAFAFTDAREQTTWAREAADGGWHLHGRKAYVTGGADADFFTIVARLESGGALAAVVDATAPGLTRSAPFSSMDGSHHVVLDLDGVRVGADALLGAPGEGLPRALAQIGDTRLAIAAEACGLMAFALGHLEARLRARAGAGVPLGDREGVRLRFADGRIDAFAARSMLYRTARLVDAGQNAINETIATKVFATEAAGRVIDMALQLEGGAALVQGHPLERLYREVRALRFTEGASDVLRLGLARGRLDLRKGRL
ncbi:MAG: acyl-CoA dehydrogenase family protein [Pseudomonadales bacterium]|nr:acyl-CoA dehydrogenase family protein [Pseudomonadales bacterium]